MTPKENLAALLHGEKQDAFVNEWEPYGNVFDPLMGATLTAKLGEYVKDPWGVTVYWGKDEPGVMPIINEDTKVLKDITAWRDYVHAPKLAEMALDWSAAKEQAAQIRSQGKLAMSLMATGLFEQSHYLMGFEDTLMNFLLEPDDMHDFLDYILEYRMTYARLLIENLHPDIVLHHDDWGSKTSLFMSPDTWREFFKDRYKRFFDLFHENDILVMHHADSFCEPIVQDMIDIGIDIWQGVLPTNDIPRLQQEFGGKIVFMGGIDSAIDVKDYDETQIRDEVKRACREYAPGGSFIPSITYGAAGSIFPGVDDIVMDEIRNQNAVYFK